MTVPILAPGPNDAADLRDHDWDDREIAEHLAEPEEPPKDRFPRIDWEEAFEIDITSTDFLAGRFMERGQQVALVGGGKVGKTLFLHNWIWCAITGRSFLGDVRREPINVLYFDRENSLRDIVTRMSSLGATPADLGRLDYRTFPGFTGGLDVNMIAITELLNIVDAGSYDLVVFDTVSRFIAGKENDSDTWLQFYARVHAPLKARGVAGVRLDHMGKDEERGSRGSSAKAQDVDHVWELVRLSENKETDRVLETETITTQLRMMRTHTRTGLGPDHFVISRRGIREIGSGWTPGGTRHELMDPGVVRERSQVVQSHVDELIFRGAPNLGREALKKWAAAVGVALPKNNLLLADVVAALKAHHTSNSVRFE